MEQKNYLKLLWIAGFIAFAAISCWATAESLHLLLPSWPIVMCWTVTIGFFIIASIGTKMIVDSLNTNIYLEKRGLKLIGGILIVVIFWFICSMPTNTHTFMYRNVISTKVNDDISRTSGYLTDIKNNTNNKAQANLKVLKLKNEINIKLSELEAEIKNESNPGNGPKAKEILRDFAKLLSVDKIDPLSYRGTSKQEREKLYDSYRQKILGLAETRARSIEHEILSPNPENIKEVNKVNDNLISLKGYIADGTVDLNEAQDVTGVDGVCDKINDGYNAIKKNQEFVNFKTEADKEDYLAQNPVTKVKRMVSVIDVWDDFFHGEFAGHGFIFWIIVSILVDIAAFIFFDLAFRKTE